MDYQQKAVNVEQPFSEQQDVMDIFTSISEGPVPEVIVYRLLRVAEVAVRDELVRVGSKERLVGLQLVYQSPLLGSSELGLAYSVEWGKVPQVEKTTENEEVSEDEEEFPEVDTEIEESGTSLSLDFIDQLITRLEESIRENTPSELIKEREIIVSISGTLALPTKEFFDGFMALIPTPIFEKPMGCGPCECPNSISPTHKKCWGADGEYKCRRGRRCTR